MTSTKYIKAINTIKKESLTSYNGNYYIFSHGINVYIGNAFRFITIDCVEYCDKLHGKKDLPYYYELARLADNNQGLTYNDGKKDIMNISTLAPRLKEMAENCYNPAHDTQIEYKPTGHNAYPERYIADGQKVTATNGDLWRVIIDCTGDNFYIYTSDKETAPVKLIASGFQYVALPIRTPDTNLINFIKSEYCN